MESLLEGWRDNASCATAVGVLVAVELVEVLFGSLLLLLLPDAGVVGFFADWGVSVDVLVFFVCA